MPSFEKPVLEKNTAFEKPTAPRQPSSPLASNSSSYFARFDSVEGAATQQRLEDAGPPPPAYNEVRVNYVSADFTLRWCLLVFVAMCMQTASCSASAAPPACVRPPACVPPLHRLHIQVVPPHDDGALHVPQTAADVKKQAEKLGRWLAGGARKLAKAAQQKAQEVQANLAQMEGQHRAKQRAGHGTYAERMDSDDEGSARHPQRAESERGRHADDDVPQHYYEWAATLAQIQDTSDRQQVLDGMPEDERAILVQLLKQQGLSDPPPGDARYACHTHTGS